MKNVILMASFLMIGALHAEVLEKVSACSKDGQRVNTVYLYDNGTAMINTYHNSIVGWVRDGKAVTDHNLQYPFNIEKYSPLSFKDKTIASALLGTIPVSGTIITRSNQMERHHDEYDTQGDLYPFGLKNIGIYHLKGGGTAIIDFATGPSASGIDRSSYCEN
jgi:hypothetical protein